MDKGLRLLFATYWNGGMWDSRAPTAEDQEQAKREGYIFDPAPMQPHDKPCGEKSKTSILPSWILKRIQCMWNTLIFVFPGEIVRDSFEIRLARQPVSGYYVGIDCIGCKMCCLVCPQKSIDITKAPVEIDPHRCMYCGRCGESCPM